jgi:hypothetical protein
MLRAVKRASQNKAARLLLAEGGLSPSGFMGALRLRQNLQFLFCRVFFTQTGTHIA